MLHENLTWEELYAMVIKFIRENIFPVEFQEYIINIINTDLENYQSAIDYYIASNQIDIDKDILKQLYQYLLDLLNFKKYDLNGDGVLDKKDLELATQLINENSEHNISYYVSSNIIIHMNDHTLSDESITDIVPIKS